MSLNNHQFQYSEAFFRNIGIVTQQEQEQIANTTVAIAGCGGVGSIYALTLARLGIGGFVLADPDTYSMTNLNRQLGATLESIGRNKAEVTRDQIRSINPDARVTVLSEGVTRENVKGFIDAADIFLDGFDFFEVNMRMRTFNEAREHAIHCITAAPFGFSATLLVFSPDGMSFGKYFNIREDMPEITKLAKFAVGLAPKALHIKYMDLRKVNLRNRCGPCIATAYGLAASLVTTEVLAILLKKRRIKAAPHYFQFDPFLQKYKQGYLFGGNRHPFQRLKINYLLNKFAKQQNP